MPPIGLLLGNVDFSSLFLVLKEGKVPAPYLTLADAKAAGAVTLNYGLFINTVISFLIIAFAVFMVGQECQPDEERVSGPASGSVDYRLSILPFSDPNKGEPLCALHV